MVAHIAFSNALVRAYDLGMPGHCCGKVRVRPSPDTCTTATYAGGQLYVLGSDGRTYVFNAAGNSALRIAHGVLVSLGAGFDRTRDRRHRRIADDVLRHSGQQSGGLDSSRHPCPATCLYSLEASAQATMGLNSSVAVSAKLSYVDSDNPTTQVPVPNGLVTFSGNVSRNVGYLSPTVAVTDANGIATVKFYSLTRSGTATITPSAALADIVTGTTIAIKK